MATIIPLTARVGNLQNGGGRNGAVILRHGQTVFDDQTPDVLYGGPGADWFLLFYTDSLRDRGAEDR